MSKDFIRVFEARLKLLGGNSGTDTNFATKANILSIGSVVTSNLTKYNNTDFVIDDDVVRQSAPTIGILRIVVPEHVKTILVKINNGVALVYTSDTQTTAPLGASVTWTAYAEDDYYWGDESVKVGSDVVTSLTTINPGYPELITYTLSLTILEGCERATVYDLSFRVLLTAVNKGYEYLTKLPKGTKIGSVVAMPKENYEFSCLSTPPFTLCKIITFPYTLNSDTSWGVLCNPI